MSRPKREPRRRCFEDFEVGKAIVSPARRVEVADFEAFADLTGDHHPVHVDEEFAKETLFGTRIAHGPLTQSVAIGLVAATGFYGDAIVALLGLDRLRALRPVRAGDAISARAEVISHASEPGSRFGRIVVSYSVRNQRAEEVMTFELVLLAKRRATET